MVEWNKSITDTNKPASSNRRKIKIFQQKNVIVFTKEKKRKIGCQEKIAKGLHIISLSETSTVVDKTVLK